MRLAELLLKNEGGRRHCEGARRVRLAQFSRSYIDEFDVSGLGPFGSLGQIVLDLLSFLQRAETLGPNFAVVHEDVAGILRPDEPVPLRVIEPFDCALRHTTK